MIVAEVKMWGTRIGVVSIEENSSYCNFIYDPDFVPSGIEVSPLNMPLSNEIYQFPTLPLTAFMGLPGLLSDALPDKYGNAIIDDWLRRNGRDKESFTVIERLCYVGTRAMGALEFYPNKYDTFDEIEDIEVKKLVELSNEILNQKKNVASKDKESINEIIKVGTSAGGARAKAIIAYNEKTGVIKSGQIDAGEGFTYWILKLGGVTQGEEEANFTKREYAYYLMAIKAQINMTESRLISLDDQYHFMTKRFERIVGKDGKVEKLHMQTLAHISYNEPGLVSYEQVTDIMDELGLPYTDKEQFYRRMVFNVMAINRDDHVKNISFLMDKKGTWSLSPAYDMTYSYNPKGKWTNRHQMMINGKRENITKEDVLKAAETMGIKQGKADQIIKEMHEVLKKWPMFAKQAKLDSITMNKIKSDFNILK